MYFDQLNWLAVLAAAVSAFAIGGIWYGPLFKNAWCREAGMDMAGANRRHPAKVFGTAFAAALVGAVAFAWSRVLGQLTVGVMMCVGVSRLYAPGFAKNQMRVLFGFGLPLAGAALLGNVAGSVDYVFVGRMVDIAAVGVYTLAFNISNWATSAIGSMLNTVVLPAFSSVKDSADRVADGVRAGERGQQRRVGVDDPERAHDVRPEDAHEPREHDEVRTPRGEPLAQRHVPRGAVGVVGQCHREGRHAGGLGAVHRRAAGYVGAGGHHQRPQHRVVQDRLQRAAAARGRCRAMAAGGGGGRGAAAPRSRRRGGAAARS